MGEFTVSGVGRETLERCAKSFAGLAQFFAELPGKRERLDESEIRDIFGEVQERVCDGCAKSSQCWDENFYRTYSSIYEVLTDIEEGSSWEAWKKERFRRQCVRADRMLETLEECFRRAKLSLMWNNRLLENRGAVAEQLAQTSDILCHMANDIYNIKRVEDKLQQQIELRLKLHGVTVKEMWSVQKTEEPQELFLTMRTRKNGTCVSTREIANLISGICTRRLVPDANSRTIVGREYSTVLFVTEPDYTVLNGAAKMTRDGELVSGDNFSMFQSSGGKMIMSLADGMGSGLEASRESSRAIELLEQFLRAGFQKETAVRMIHSTMMMQNGGQSFSTMDMCVIDLYSGVCEFLKLGAATTFLKRKGWVETVTSTSMPMGILADADYECTTKQLQDGDFVVMVSDGVPDALPGGESEELLKEMILEVETSNARDMAKQILERVMKYRRQCVSDDMTVLVGGIWKR